MPISAPGIHGSQHPGKFFLPTIFRKIGPIQMSLHFIPYKSKVSCVNLFEYSFVVICVNHNQHYLFFNSTYHPLMAHDIKSMVSPPILQIRSERILAFGLSHHSPHGWLICSCNIDFIMLRRAPLPYLCSPIQKRPQVYAQLT